MSTNVENEITYSTQVSERNYFNDRPLRFSIDPVHNTVPAGKYTVKNGRLVPARCSQRGQGVI